jgi:hypothetical protein
MRTNDAGMSDRESPPPRRESKPKQAQPDRAQKMDDKRTPPREQPPKQAARGSAPGPMAESVNADEAKRPASDPRQVEDELNDPDGYEDESVWQRGSKSAGSRGKADGRR